MHFTVSKAHPDAYHPDKCATCGEQGTFTITCTLMTEGQYVSEQHFCDEHARVVVVQLMNILGRAPEED